MHLRFVTIPVLALSACYGGAPRTPPTVPLPRLIPGEPIAVTTVSRTAMENVAREARTCNEQHPDQCTVTRYTETVPVTRVYTRARYRGDELTYAQLRVMTEPDHDRDLSRLASLSRACRRADVPRWTGLGLLVIGLGSFGFTGSTAGKVVSTAALGGGIGSYALGYYSFGGRDCVRARRISDRIDMSGKLEWVELEGDAYAAELATLAGEFNARQAALRPRPAPAPAAVEVAAKPTPPTRGKSKTKRSLRMRK